MKYCDTKFGIDTIDSIDVSLVSMYRAGLVDLAGTAVQCA